MEWVWVVALVVVLFGPLVWASAQRLRRGERGDEAYRGEGSDATALEIGARRPRGPFTG